MTDLPQEIAGRGAYSPKDAESESPDNAQTAEDNLRFLLRFPDRCAAEVTRVGESQPCDKVAVAVAEGDTDGWRCGFDAWWPVCPHHSRGRKMVPLAVVFSVLKSAVYADGYQDAVRYTAEVGGRIKPRHYTDEDHQAWADD